MENKEFIMESILSIEDFNNVDPKLMNIINSNREYRRIFEEYREVSALTSECIPAPKKNGISLHDAVMTRVRNGDTAPRYINASPSKRFMFPMATAASLAIVLVVAVIAVTATRSHSNNRAMDLAASESEENIRTMPENVQFAPSISQGASPSDDGVVTYSYRSPEEEGTEAYIEDYSEYDDSDTENAKTVTYDKASGAAYSVELPSSDRSLASTQKSTENGSLSEESAAEYSVDEILSRLSLANSKDISEEDAITVEDIEAYGRENFISWFDSISDSEDFTELYGKKQFIRYCTEQAKTE